MGRVKLRLAKLPSLAVRRSLFDSPYTMVLYMQNILLNISVNDITYLAKIERYFTINKA